MTNFAPFFALHEQGPVRLESEDWRQLASIFTEIQSFPAGVELIREDVTSARVLAIEDGWLGCYKLLRSGDRQVIDFRLPGDVVGLRDLLLERASYSSMTLTPVRARTAHAEDFMRIMASNSRLMAAVFWMLGQEEATVVDNLVSLGQQTALEHTADLIYGLWQRQKRAGLAERDCFPFPIPHVWLADALGISPVHVSRTLRTLRELGLIDMKNRSVQVLSPHRLAAFVNGESAWV